MTTPRNLDAETTAWLQAQITMAASRASAAAMQSISEEVRKIEDWANGLFIVLQDVLPPLLRDCDALREQLGPRWRAASERYDLLEAAGPGVQADESLEMLEGRKMLYRMYDVAGLWNPPPRAQFREQRRA